MHTFRNGAVLIGSILLAPLSMAAAQSTELAYASPAKSGYVVFVDRDLELSSTAGNTVRQAATAARSAHTVYLAGRADYAGLVKKELIRDGVPASAIVVQGPASNPLPKTGDGVADPANRRVEISF
jgi:hypothetical protein